MFTIGEFAALAHVSRRLLRYYDEIGLFCPAHTDRATGYRYYTGEQLAVLNRILVLKELGLSLDQIQALLYDHVSADEMQGMLLLKKAEIEQQLRAELQRIHRIEARLQAIRHAETGAPMDVVIKQIPALSALSVRTVLETFADVWRLQHQVRRALPASGGYGLSFLICHDDDIVERDMNLEVGCLLPPTRRHAPVRLADGLELRLSHLPPVETMATTVVTGGLEMIHAAYGEIGLWASLNGYRPVGVAREITLQHANKADGRDLVTEIQFPVEVVQ